MGRLPLKAVRPTELHPDTSDLADDFPDPLGFDLLV